MKHSSSVGDAGVWQGPWRRYDLVKEFVIALLVVGVLSMGLVILFSSPDDRSVSLAHWARATPNDFVLTSVTELDGTSASATYGAPYNTGGQGQKLGPLALQRWAGVTIPVDSANEFAVNPLRTIPSDPALSRAWRCGTRPAPTRERNGRPTMTTPFLRHPTTTPRGRRAETTAPSP